MTLIPGVTVRADVALPGIFADHMVLQRGEPIPVWGFAEPGESVTVAFVEATINTEADAEGYWRVDLPAMGAGGPYTLAVTGANRVTFKDVYVGEVWLCSGQSNMQWPVRLSADAEAEIAAGDWPMVRMFTAGRALWAEEQTDMEGTWAVCSPETVGDFSAVGYYFGRKLHKELGVPIGLVHSSWGGSRAEPWTPREALLNHPAYKPNVDQIDAVRAEYLENRQAMDAKYAKEAQAYESRLGALFQRLGFGGKGLEDVWQSPETDVSEWGTAHAPGPWESNAGAEMSGFDGVAWYRRNVSIPQTWAGKKLLLKLGRIDDADTTYFDGKPVGATGFNIDNPHTVIREYVIPADLVTAGEHVITVRIADKWGSGGFIETPDTMVIVPVDSPDAEPVSLAGEWLYRSDFAIHGPDWPVAPVNPATIGAEFASPAAMYNAMLHPLVPYAMRGAVWYQGESNASEAEAYRELLPLMIRGWRDACGKPDMPFGIVQLANFLKPPVEPGDSHWGELRDAQLHTFKMVDHVGLAVTIDIGDADDIHPRNKQDVGKRLALWALSEVYGHDLEWSGPIYQSMRVEDGKVILAFNHLGGGLQARGGGALGGFSIAGEDQKFVWANAKIVGERVVVWHDDVPEPVAVRYGWADNPDTANLINAMGLPATPFRTDDWRGVTRGH